MDENIIPTLFLVFIISLIILLFIGAFYIISRVRAKQGWKTFTDNEIEAAFKQTNDEKENVAKVHHAPKLSPKSQRVDSKVIFLTRMYKNIEGYSPERERKNSVEPKLAFPLRVAEVNSTRNSKLFVIKYPRYNSSI